MGILKRVIVSPAGYPRFREIAELARSLCHSWATCQDGGCQQCLICFGVDVDHPRRSLLYPEIRLDRVYGFENSAILLYLSFYLQTVYSRPFLGRGHISPNTITYRPNPEKGPSLRGSACLSRKVVYRFDLSVRPRKKWQGRTGQSRKSQMCYISRSWEEAPTEPLYTTTCVVGFIRQIIAYAKFRAEIFRG